VSNSHSELLHDIPPSLWKSLLARCCRDDHILAHAVLSYHNHEFPTEELGDEEGSAQEGKGSIVTLEGSISLLQFKLATTQRAGLAIQLTTDLLSGLLQPSFLRHWISTSSKEPVMSADLDLVTFFAKLLFFTPPADLLGSGSSLQSISSRLRIIAYDPTQQL
jgi:hypothetical protein